MRIEHWIGSAAVVLMTAAGGCDIVAGIGEYCEIGVDCPASGSGAGGVGGATGGNTSTGGDTGGSGGASGACAPTATQPCAYTGTPETENQGECHAGKQTCGADGTWGPCQGEVTPVAEDCSNDKDEDCDGVACSVLISSFLWGDDKNQSVLRVAADGAGNTYAVGKFSGELNFSSPKLVAMDPSLFVLKLDKDVIPSWSTSYGTIGEIGTGAISATSSGDLAITGLFSGVLNFGGNVMSGTSRSYVARLDGAGSTIWSKKLDCSPSLRSRAVSFDSADEVLVAGDFQCNIDLGAGALSSQAGQDIFVAALSSPDAKASWSRQFGNASFQAANAILGVDDGKAVAAGLFQGAVDFGATKVTADMDLGPDLFVTTLDSSGIPLFTKGFGGTHYQQTLARIVLDDVAVAGWFSNSTNFGGDTLSGGAGSVFIARFTSEVEHVWSRSFGGPQFEPAIDAASSTVSVATDSKGNIVVSTRGKGTVDFGGGGLGKAGDVSEFLVKLDPDGKHLWSKAFGPVAPEGGCVVAVSPKDEPILACSIDAPSISFGKDPPLTGKGGLDVVVAKFNP